MIAGMVAATSDLFIVATVGAVCAALSLVGFLWINFGRPWLRTRKLRRSCDVHFVIRAREKYQLGYALQDDERHHVKTLSLPAHSTVYVEIGIYPLIHFQETEVVFGCVGEIDRKPYAVAWVDKFSEQEQRFVPGESQGHFLDIEKWYHRRKDNTKNVGSHYVHGYELVTREPGTYKTYLAFGTTEIEGSAELSIVVEEKPRTRMKCSMHPDCYVKPARHYGGPGSNGINRVRLD